MSTGVSWIIIIEIYFFIFSSTQRLLNVTAVVLNAVTNFVLYGVGINLKVFLDFFGFGFMCFWIFCRL